MELWQQIFCNMLQNEEMEIRFPQAPDMVDMLNSRCYRLLEKIHYIIKDGCVSDEECFMKIEEILVAFEDMGISGGDRHDF